MAEKRQWIGFGTAVELVTQRAGIRTCAKCQGRKRRLNHLLPRVFKVSMLDWGKPQVPGDQDGAK